MTDPTPALALTAPPRAVSGPLDAPDLPEDFAPPRLTLRGIVSELLLVDAMLAATDGELTPDMEAAQEAAFDALASKADGIRDYLASLDAEAAHVKAEEQRLKEFRARIETRADKLRAYVVAQMDRRGLDAIPGEFSKGLRLKRSTASTITDEAALPDAYVYAETVTKIDKAAILKALRAGEEIPGAALVTNVTLQTP